ncbi:hypothetical protein F4818DRAFT_404938 [Hypoxylon cercidicola]|nr:hypothetical protein F4818DRAFT_404938 [Hypoxylon cercidicola]
MASIKTLAKALVLTVVGGAALPPTPRQQLDDVCCFGLASVGRVNETVLEDHVGDLILGGSFQEGNFCIDKAAKTVHDGLRHNCFMRAPDYQFECYQGAVGTTAFDTTFDHEDGKAYLTYDNGPGVFFACPVTENNEVHYNLFSDEANKTDCEPVSLALVDPLDTCLIKNSNDAERSVAELDTSPPTLSVWPPVLSQGCVVSPSAPSIAPYKTVINSGNSISWSGKNTTAMASITPTNTTVFYFDIPRRLAASSSTCALEFRMPACEDLPSDYPCYLFSGLEQEFLQNSGMTFSRNGALPGWNDTELHQVMPGETNIIGTFECNQMAGPHGWRASSVRNFVLEFVQAGVGPNAKFKDGVGAFVVECQQPLGA